MSSVFSTVLSIYYTIYRISLLSAAVRCKRQLFIDWRTVDIDLPGLWLQVAGLGKLLGLEIILCYALNTHAVNDLLLGHAET